jgi:hypothetical protein
MKREEEFVQVTQKQLVVGAKLHIRELQELSTILVMTIAHNCESCLVVNVCFSFDLRSDVQGRKRCRTKLPRCR